jgi:hypothetical protein
MRLPEPLHQEVLPVGSGGETENVHHPVSCRMSRGFGFDRDAIRARFGTAEVAAS